MPSAHGPVGRRGAGAEPISIEEALQIPALRSGMPDVLAGHAGLSRPIRWVHASETRETPTVLKGGELLLTTGMGMPHGGDAAARWLADFDECGIAGLVIELGGAVKTVPSAAVKEAEKRGLPLIALHRKIAFIEATEVLHQRILGHQTAIEKLAEEAQAKLTDLLIGGAGTADLINALADLLDTPVILARSSGAIIFHAGRMLRDVDLAGLWESRCRGLATAPDVLSVPIRVGTDERWGELVAVAAGRSLESADAAILTRAAPCIAVATSREHETRALLGRARGDFLHALAYGSQEITEQEIAHGARLLKFDQRSDWLLAVVVGNSIGHLYDDQWEQLSNWIQDHARTAGRAAIVGLRQDAEGILLVVSLGSSEERAAAAESLGEAVRSWAEGTQTTLSAPKLEVSAGRTVRSWRELRSTIRDTLESSAAARWRDQALWHDASAPDVLELLVPLRDRRVLERFVTAQLELLIRHDEQHRSELVRTLETYYRAGGKKAKAARLLHVERQSVYKRLTRIESILGVDLGDMETQLALQLALRARRFVEP
ncbi:MAG: PucR family transcriptional regulator [Actinobacteria bacterium]|nr:PucR family transcriptional regulator [Actinomycetota bacterium]